jgi:hypothetical protein
MKISEFRRVLKAIEECDDCIKNRTLFSLVSGGLGTCIAGAVIQRRHNLIEQLKMAGVNIEEVV